MEPPNKGLVGDNINSAVLSFIERLSSFGDSQCINSMGKVIWVLQAMSFIKRFIIQCPSYGGFTINMYLGGSIVVDLVIVQSVQETRVVLP